MAKTTKPVKMLYWYKCPECGTEGGEHIDREPNCHSNECNYKVKMKKVSERVWYNG